MIVLLDNRQLGWLRFSLPQVTKDQTPLVIYSSKRKLRHLSYYGDPGQQVWLRRGHLPSVVNTVVLRSVIRKGPYDMPYIHKTRSLFMTTIKNAPNQMLKKHLCHCRLAVGIINL
jgi:hypothetical protein